MFHDFNTDRVFGVKSPEHPEGARDGMQTTIAGSGLAGKPKS